MCNTRRFSWMVLAGVLGVANGVVAQSVAIDLGTLGGSFSRAVAVNNNGQVVGSSWTLTGETHAFSWTHAGGLVDLGTFGGTRTEAYAVNEHGQVVGFSLLPGDSEFRAFSWTPAGGITDLGTLGGSSSQAYAVNSRGQVVGRSYYSHGTRATHAFSRTPNGGMIDLGTLGGSQSEAHAVNDKGQVVGFSYTAGDAEIHAFSWTRRGGHGRPRHVGGHRKPGDGRE
jgi:probable HAF family extracellular repeat protein